MDTNSIISFYYKFGLDEITNQTICLINENNNKGLLLLYFVWDFKERMLYVK